MCLVCSPRLPEAQRRWGKQRLWCYATLPNPTENNYFANTLVFLFYTPSWWYFFHCHLLFPPFSLLLLSFRIPLQVSITIHQFYLLTVLPLGLSSTPPFGIESLFYFLRWWWFLLILGFLFSILLPSRWGFYFHSSFVSYLFLNFALLSLSAVSGHLFIYFTLLPSSFLCC